MSAEGGQTKDNVSGWTVDTLHSHIDGVLKERNERYMEKFAAADKAVQVAETNTAEWKKTNNEWRGAMQDKDKQVMSRTEIQAELNALRVSIGTIRNLSLSAILVCCSVITVVVLLTKTFHQ